MSSDPYNLKRPIASSNPKVRGGYQPVNRVPQHFVAAIHPYDYTIRPQVVNKKTCKKYYTLIKNFEDLTGIGGVLNTSMNLHDKPIISNPQDIINEIISDKFVDINHIYIHDTLFIRKKILIKKL